MAVYNRNLKICATCQYWTGHGVRVKDRIQIQCDSDEPALCNVTGFKKRAGSFCTCGKHQKKCGL